jgi:hypothetical protein
MLKRGDKMRTYHKLCIVLLLLTFAVQFINIKSAEAFEVEKNIVLLIDNSGSMQTSDPDKLSVVAASILIDSIESNTNLNIISFGNKPVFSYNLSDRPSREALKQDLSNMKFNDGNTDMKAGLKEALNQLEKVQGEKAIIVLSDGMEDPIGGLTSAHMEGLDSLVEIAHQSQIKINCIGLTKEADSNTLSKITFKTGGEYYYCENASELFKVFGSILGGMTDFFTIEEYIVESKAEKAVKLSSYIEEVIVKVASTKNKAPLISVMEDGKELPAEKIGDSYKIYRFDNGENRTLNILPRDNEKNYVSVQIKSKEKINIDSMGHNFSVPCEVPLDIDLSLINMDIKGLHMDKIEGQTRENIDIYENSFRFTFEKKKRGQYPILITAYDGDSNIIAVKNFNINVTDYPPFNYIEETPKEMIIGSRYEIKLKELSGKKADKRSGEIIIDYGSDYERFPLISENNMLQAEVSPKKSGDYKITAYINGTYNNEEFSYYLPYKKIRIKETPTIRLEAVDTKMTVKQNENIELSLRINENNIYEEEEIKILDINNKEIAKINIKIDTTGIVKVPITLKNKGNNLLFRLKGRENLILTEKLNTNIKVISALEYYGKPFIFPSILVLFLVLLITTVLWILKRSYIQYSEYSISKEITYRLKLKPIYDSLNITLSVDSDKQWLDLKGDSITAEEYDSPNSIGYFTLNTPKGGKLLLGLKYLLNKDKIFSIEYCAVKDQQIKRDEEEIYEVAVEYEENIQIEVKNNKEYIIINFL